MLTLSLAKPRIPMVSMGLGIWYILLIGFFLPTFLKWDTNLYVGILIAPFVANLNTSTRSWRYLLPTAIVLSLTLWLPVKTLFFITVILSFIVLIESTIGKVNEALLLLLILISPVFKYLISPVDFPMRLWLTDKTVQLLRLLGTKANVVGNIIELDGFSFAVDPACAGLNMLTLSLMLCLFTFSFYQQQERKNLSRWLFFSLVILTIGLNIVSNFFRILLLVHFKLMPSTFFHDFVGILCLVAYVVAPLLIAMRLMFKFSGTPRPRTEAKIEKSTSLKSIYLNLFLIGTLTFVGTKLVNADTLSVAHDRIQIYGYKKERLPSGILKFKANDALIYIKPALFFVPGHDPKLCWTGSGYIFEQVKKERVADTEVYTAFLTKGKDKIYAAWWFDNGILATTDQLLWRWKGATTTQHFYLINVNAANRKDLVKKTTDLLLNRNYLTSRNP